MKILEVFYFKAQYKLKNIIIKKESGSINDKMQSRIQENRVYFYTDNKDQKWFIYILIVSIDMMKSF